MNEVVIYDGINEPELTDCRRLAYKLAQQLALPENAAFLGAHLAKIAALALIRLPSEDLIDLFNQLQIDGLSEDCHASPFDELVDEWPNDEILPMKRSD